MKKKTKKMKKKNENEKLKIRPKNTKNLKTQVVIPPPQAKTLHCPQCSKIRNKEKIRERIQPEDACGSWCEARAGTTEEQVRYPADPLPKLISDQRSDNGDRSRRPAKHQAKHAIMQNVMQKK